jgi:hypothetical protein
MGFMAPLKPRPFNKRGFSAAFEAVPLRTLDSNPSFIGYTEALSDELCPLAG